MNLGNRIKANIGFSIIELLVAIAVFAVMTAALMQMTTSSYDNASYLQGKIGQLSLINDIRYQISKSSSCLSGLKTTQLTNPLTTPIELELDLGDGRIVKSDSDLNNTYNIFINNFQLLNAVVEPGKTQLTDSSITATNAKVVSGQLLLQASSKFSALSSRAFKPVTLGRFYLLIDENSKIIDCNNLETSQANALAGSCAVSSGGGPFTDSQWNLMRSAICSSATFPMSSNGAGATLFCSTKKTGNIQTGLTYNITSCSKSQPSAYSTYNIYYISGFGPYTTQQECLNALPNSGLNFSYSDGNGSLYKSICITGHWSNFDSAPNSPNPSSPQQSGDGT